MSKLSVIDELRAPKVREVNLAGADPSTVIVNDKVIGGLKEIANQYEKGLEERAQKYAEDQVSGTFDSDEELLAEAKASLDAVYGEKRQKAQSNLQLKTDELSEERRSLANDRTRALSGVAEEYEGKSDRLAEDIAKQGLSHSSISSLAAEELKREEAGKAADVNYRYDKRIAAIDSKIERLTASYEQALKNYELSYAVQLEKDLNRLKSKRNRMENEYQKEHAAEKRQAYNAYLEDEKQRALEYEEREGDYTGLKKENYLARYDYLLSALKDKKPDRIRRFLKETEDDLREYLGLYYERFVKEVS